MCNLSQGVEEKGIAKGLARGRAEGRAEATVTLIRNLMDRFTLPGGGLLFPCRKNSKSALKGHSVP